MKNILRYRNSPLLFFALAFTLVFSMIGFVGSVAHGRLPSQSIVPLANEPGPTPCGGGDHGDGLPSPFDVNQKVELAHEENYILMGTIKLQNGTPILEVDLEVHPWLASKRRKAVPFYPIIRPTSLGVKWREYENEYVRMVVEARANIFVHKTTGKKQYVVSLYPLKAPIVVSEDSLR